MLVRPLVPALLVCALGCVERLPPVATPLALSPPGQPSPSTTPGRGRLLVDVVEGPSPVRHLTLESAAIDVGHDRRLRRAAREAAPACTTPCLLDLPYGRHALAFPLVGSERRLEIVAVDVGPQPAVYRRSLGTWESAGPMLPLGIVALGLGGAAVLTGASLASVGYGTDDDPMALAGGITFGAGAVLSTLAILAFTLSPAHERPGAGVQFPWIVAMPAVRAPAAAR